MNDASGAVLSSPIFKLSCSSLCLFHFIFRWWSLYWSAHPVHIGVRTRLSTQANFTLDTATSPQPPPVDGFAILLIIVCMLLMTPPLLWLYRRHGKKVRMYFRRLRVSQTSTPALLQKIDPGDGTSVPIPVFMPTQTSRAPSHSMRQLFLPRSLDRASGVHPPLRAGSWRSFRLLNRYSGGSIYPSLPPIPTSSNTFIDEGNTVMGNSTFSNIYISGLPLQPPGLVSTPPRVHLGSSYWTWITFADSIVIVLGMDPQRVTSRERCRSVRFLSIVIVLALVLFHLKLSLNELIYIYISRSMI